MSVKQNFIDFRKRKSGGLDGYDILHGGIVELLEAARRMAARTVNTFMTATYWEIGRRIIEAQQKGKRRANYGEQLISFLAKDLSQRFGRGFSARNLEQMRAFYLAWQIPQTLSAEFGQITSHRSSSDKSQTLSAISHNRNSSPDLTTIAARFPLPWSAYVRLLSVNDPAARAFYEAEALRGGWTIRQLDRQIESQFYQRVALSRNKAAMLRKGSIAQPADAMTPEEAIKDPYILEFLDLKDEYSETALENALIHRLEDFLLELGDEFTFVGRQRRLRIGDEWYRIDLLFFHRRLRCLIIIDLKIGRLTHADAGQMHLYLNYAREHWMLENENPPVGLILCARKDTAVAHYALEGLSNKVLAAEYRTVLPDADQIAAELTKATKALEARRKAVKEYPK